MAESLARLGARGARLRRHRSPSAATPYVGANFLKIHPFALLFHTAALFSRASICCSTSCGCPPSRCCGRNLPGNPTRKVGRRRQESLGFARDDHCGRHHHAATPARYPDRRALPTQLAALYGIPGRRICKLKIGQGEDARRHGYLAPSAVRQKAKTRAGPGLMEASAAAAASRWGGTAAPRAASSPPARTRPPGAAETISPPPR